MPSTFVAVYRGPDPKTADLVALSTSPRIVAAVSELLLREPPPEGLEDPALGVVQGARRRALRLIHQEAEAALAPAGAAVRPRRRRPRTSGDPESAA